MRVYERPVLLYRAAYPCYAILAAMFDYIIRCLMNYYMVCYELQRPHMRKLVNLGVQFYGTFWLVWLGASTRFTHLFPGAHAHSDPAFKSKRWW